MAYNEDSSASGQEPWIHWFCGLKGHEMFCHVERAYIEDGFNLYGLRACVSNYSDCLDLILDRIGQEDSGDSDLTQSACALYGLIHARYIVTTHGLDSMYNKYAAKEFGVCPLIQCSGQPVLPVGLRDEPGIDTAKVFCPKCKNVYQPSVFRSSSRGNGGGGGGAVDGAAFGTTFPHLFLMTFNNLVPDPHPPDSAYVPRVFGFRVHRSAHRGSGGEGTVGAYSGNGRRVGGASSYVQRSTVNMASTRVAGGSSRGGNGVPMQEMSNGVKDDEKEEEDDVEGGGDIGMEAANEVVSASPKPLKTEDCGNDGEQAEEDERDDCAIDETAEANDVNRKREKGDNSDRSSNASKRQRCSVEAVT